MSKVNNKNGAKLRKRFPIHLKEQDIKIPVENIDDCVVKTNIKRRHSSLLPNSIRAVFCGPSNCGKTNALISLIKNENGLYFENIYLYSKSLNQPKYRYLETLLKPIKELGFYQYHDREEVVSPSEAKPNSLMIFDDIACEKQDHLKAYFCMGRHKNVDSFYLCQSYAQVPKHLVRDNINFMVIFRQDEMNLKHIYKDHVNTDMSFELFKELCSQCWYEKFGFLVIDKDSDINDGRYRKGFYTYFINISQ
jgi:hypothetical protein